MSDHTDRHALHAVGEHRLEEVDGTVKLEHRHLTRELFEYNTDLEARKMCAKAEVWSSPAES